jgi:predicted nuclease with TOPRIM domain
VSRYLFVGGETAANPEVVQKAQELAANDKEAQFALLVPATQVRLLLGRHEGENVEVAKRMAEDARRKFAECGIELRTHIGPPDPEQAVTEELAARGYDVIVISTYPARKSRWLAKKFPDKVGKRHGLPVIHVEAPPEYLLNFADLGPFL